MDPERDRAPEPTSAGADNAQRRARGLLVGLAVVYALVLVVLYAAGVFLFVWKTAVVPALFVVALAARRFLPFVRDWAVFLAAVALFDSLRGLVYGVICRYSLRAYMGYAIAGEQALFGTPVPSARLQAALFSRELDGTLERVLVGLHASHFLVFLFFGLWLWLARPRAFPRFRRAMLLAMYAALGVYLVLPTLPPWMAAGRFHVIEPVAHVTARIYNVSMPTLAQSFDVNPIAAMPSLHTAFPALIAIFAVESLGLLGWVLAAYALAVGFAIVALGEHYVVDVLLGACLAAVAYVATRRVSMDQRKPPLGRAELPRPLLAALGLLVLSQLAGLTARAWSTDFVPNEAFIDTELEGKSPTASFYRAERAFAARDYARAEVLFERAKHELPTIPEQVMAYARLAESAFAARDYAVTVQTLAAQPQLTSEQGLMLAEARLALGQRVLGFELLDALLSEHPGDSALRARAAALERAYRR